jgi:tRNA G10  N-methylase Trm11
VTDGRTIYSCQVAANSHVFRDILSLYVPLSSRVADVTYGKGSFWKEIRPGIYEVIVTDIATGTDCRSLPYDAKSIDCVVFDPPYMEGFHRHEAGQLSWPGRDMGQRFSNGAVQLTTTKYHAAVLELYAAGCREAFRVLKPDGILIVKCQDEVSNHRQNLTHVEVIVDVQSIGMRCEDIFVVVQRGKPAPRPNLKCQQHARKNHSYFLVFKKTGRRRD